MSETNFEDWLTCELFDYLKVIDVISEDEEFEDWKFDRTDMLKLCKENEEL